MYKALVSFAGAKVSMSKGSVREISDPTLVKDLLSCGYIEEVLDKPEKKEEPEAKKKKNSRKE